MVDQYEEFFELQGDLDHRCEDHNKGAILLAGVDLRVDRLHDLDGTEEPMEVLQDQDRGPLGACQRVE